MYKAETKDCRMKGIGRDIEKDMRTIGRMGDSAKTRAERVNENE